MCFHDFFSYHFIFQIEDILTNRTVTYSTYRSFHTLNKLISCFFSLHDRELNAPTQKINYIGILQI